MAIFFLAFGKTPSVITKKTHILHCLKADDVQIVFYNDYDTPCHKGHTLSDAYIFIQSHYVVDSIALFINLFICSLKRLYSASGSSNSEKTLSPL